MLERYRCATTNLKENTPEVLRGWNIIHLSDFHWHNIDDIITFRERLREVLKDADPSRTIVLATGDFVCNEVGKIAGFLHAKNSPETPWKEIQAEVLKIQEDLLRFRYCFNCWGNHDVSHSQFRDIRSTLSEIFHDLNIQTQGDDLSPPRNPKYRDMLTKSGTIRIIVTHDYTLNSWNQEHYHERGVYHDGYLEALEGLANEKSVGATIVLTHNSEWAEHFQVQVSKMQNTFIFSGHTHKGLFGVPGIRSAVLWHLGYRSRLNGGIYQIGQEKIRTIHNGHKPDRDIDFESPTVFVSRGLGDCPFFRKLRLFCRHEILKVVG